MADVLTVCAALMVLFGFSFLFWFIRRLGILQLEAAMMQDAFQSPKPDPQPMVEVKNPFKMTVSPSCTLGCVETVVNCTYPCHIIAYWNVRKQYLDEMVDHSSPENEETSRSDLNILQRTLEENSKTVVSQEFTKICSGKKLSYNVQDLIEHPSSIGAANHDIALYDLVVTMELTGEQRGRIESQSSITAMVIGICLQRQNENLKTSVVQQYVQTKSGKLFKLKKLFLEEQTNEDASPSPQEESNNLCIVCQMMPISRALIPCGHACLCALCFDKVNACPMCRQPMTSSFVLREEPNLNRNNEYEFSEILKRMNPIEIIRGIYNAS